MSSRPPLHDPDIVDGCQNDGNADVVPVDPGTDTSGAPVSVSGGGVAQGCVGT